MFDIFVINSNNTVKKHYPHACEIKNLSLCEAVQWAAKNSSTEMFWVLSGSNDYSEFDLQFEPAWHQRSHLHVWPSNNQCHGGSTLLVNRRQWLGESPGDLLEYSTINWHSNALISKETADIFVWDFGGHQQNIEQILQQYPDAKVLRYFGTHLDMFKKTVKKAKKDSVWILSSCCNYDEFDPFWLPDWHNQNQIHVWASGDQQFGDTFWVDVESAKQCIDDLEELEYFSKGITWHSSGYARLEWPINHVETHDLHRAISNHKFSSVYEYFVSPGSTLGSTVDESIWKKRRLIAYNNNGHVVLTPRDALNAISDKILSYPYIKYHKCEKSTQKPQDIVFISYDEKNADLTWNQLKNRFPRAKRVHGVDGMLNAYQAAAEQSSTPWFFAVFGKTQLVDDFAFDFCPNYLESSGNYVFYAYNPVLDHSYGNGGVILYNRDWVLDLDSQSHDIDITMTTDLFNIPRISCVNNMAADPWTAWKTAFREAYKLKYYSEQRPNIQDEYHLHLWLTRENTKHGIWSRRGAEQAVKHYNSLPADAKKDLRLNDRQWLRQQFNACVNTVNNSFNFAV